MLKTKFQDVVFTIIMIIFMVYGMVCREKENSQAEGAADAAVTE